MFPQETKKEENTLKKSKVLFIVSLVCIVLGSFFASMLNTSMFTVDVKEIEFKTEHGTLSGLLYMPKDASKDDPRPVIVTTHGYLNSKEMQDAPAIEMSRRGYIVLAVDMYDHGDSRWDSDIKVNEQFSTFWVYSQFDAATYMAQQNYTKKDANGNAYLAVEGHSMGGFSSLVALYMDEMASLKTGVRSIYTGISLGADYSYASAIAPQSDIQAAFGDRTIGMVAGHYDEFFFNKSDEEKTSEEKKVNGTVTYKDFVTTTSGKQFLGINNENAKAGTFYNVDSGNLLYNGTPVRTSQTGQHIIYTPNETHPWNHFSKTTTGYIIDFYQTAFANVTSSSQTNVDLGSDHQIWYLKEFFNMIALIGFFLLIVPLAGILLNIPFFKNAVTEAVPSVCAPVTSLQKAAYWISFIACTLYPAVFFNTLMDKQQTGLNMLSILSLITIVCGITIIILGKKRANLTFVKGGITTVIITTVTGLIFLFAKHIFPLSAAFNEPVTNQIVYWAMCNGLIALIVTALFFILSKQKAGTDIKAYGVNKKISSILKSFLLALATVVIAYLVLFLIEKIFGVDFRIWTFAVKTFKAPFVVIALRYVPFFFIYYAINVIALNANTRNKKGGYALAIIMNIGGLLLWLLCQYGKDFATGVSFFPAQALNGIVLFGIIPGLAVAAIYAKALFNKTNNIWLASFVNSMLFTMITVANTAMFWNMVN